MNDARTRQDEAVAVRGDDPVSCGGAGACGAVAQTSPLAVILTRTPLGNYSVAMLERATPVIGAPTRDATMAQALMTFGAWAQGRRIEVVDRTGDVTGRAPTPASLRVPPTLPQCGVTGGRSVLSDVGDLA